MTWEPTVQNCNNYMDERTGKYEYRAVRYRKAIETMIANGLDLENDTIFDIGAGRTEFARTLYSEYGFKGMYIPVDGGIDGTDLSDYWIAPRNAEWFVALELLEHVYTWPTLVMNMKVRATKGIVISTPNPRTTDVLGMDPTHVRVIYPQTLRSMNFKVTEETFYGSAFNLPGKDGEPDSLLGVWTR